MRIYLDSVIIIYLVEGITPYTEALESRLANRKMIPVTSDLARLECRVQPLRDGQEALLAAFDSFFGNVPAEIIPLTRQVVDRATELRAHYGFKTPDAIHLAAAILGRCDIFLTNDERLNRCAEIAIEHL